MILEREWKFVVARLPVVPTESRHEAIHKGYINPGTPTLRVRTKGGHGYLTIKLPPGKEEGSVRGGPLVRQEFEYEIPEEDARVLVAASRWTLRKTRYYVDGGIELDIFEGPHEGLILAEVEVREETEAPVPPVGWEWIDVTRDPRYSNRALAELGIPRDAVLAMVGE